MRRSRIGRLPETFYDRPKPSTVIKAARITRIPASHQEVPPPPEAEPARQPESEFKEVVRTDGIYRNTAEGDAHSSPELRRLEVDRGEHRNGHSRRYVHNEPWSRVTVILKDRQRALLDALSERIEEETGSNVRRSPFIRALIDAFLESNMKYQALQSENAIREIVKSRLKG